MKEFFGKEIFESRPKAGPPPWRTKRRPLQKKLASYAKPARTDFQQIYKDETSRIDLFCEDSSNIMDRGKLANKESKPTTKQHRLTAEVTKSTPCGTPTDFCHSRRGPSQGDTCCAGTSESH